MVVRKNPDEIVARMDHERRLIAEELPELHRRDARLQEAAAEETLCGHLRRAIHQSRRPLADIAAAAGVSTGVLCGFLEGERTVRSDVLDRLAQAVALVVVHKS